MERMRKLIVNGRFLCQRLTGVNRFAYELCRALICRGEELLFICPNVKVCSDYDISNFSIRYFGIGKSHFWEQIFLPLCCKQYKNYILINFSSIGPIIIKHKIITIHDLAFMVRPSWYLNIYVLVYKFLTPISVKTAEKVLTVSEFSKTEIIKYLQTSPSKIQVIYNASASIFKAKQYTFRSSEKYLLAVSTIDPRKNFNRLIQAYLTWPNNQNVKLYVVGGKNVIYSEIECMETVSSNIIWLGRVSDIELAELYRNALGFIYPSLYEGFGLPPLEAMSSGAPVIVSDIPPHREVCGSAAIYVDPYNTASMVNAFDVLLNEASVVEMRERGLKQASCFSWDASAETLLQILNTQ